MQDENQTASVRLDKWLWAARFFKTRTLAKQAIEGGKVHYDGQRVKTSKMVTVGAELRIRCGWDEKTVIVHALSAQRRGAPEAALLYEETTASIEQRALRTEERRAANTGFDRMPRGKPTKKERRHIHRFKRSGGPDDETQHD